jgi:hypothetical protein
VVRWVVVPSPTWPFPLSPQAQTVPSERNASEWPPLPAQALACPHLRYEGHLDKEIDGWAEFGLDSRPCIMNRTDFEQLRDVPGKVIRSDIRFAKSRQTAPVLIAEVVVESADRRDLRLTIKDNPEVSSKTFNVDVPGIGPICRLDVDGHNHPGKGRQHKHALQTERCPDRNLPDAVQARPELSGWSIRDLFKEFCRLGGISHGGKLYAPDEEDGGP